MEKALVSLLNSLVKTYEVTLVLEEKKGMLLKELDKDIKVEEYTLSTSTNVVFRKIQNFIKRFFWTLNFKNKYDFSCNYATYSIIGSRLAQVASKNSTYYVHSDYYSVYNKNSELIDGFFRPHKIDDFENIVFVSNEAKNNLLSIYGGLEKKFNVINNLIEVDKIKKLASFEVEEKIFSEDKINLLFVGRLDNGSKNLDLLIESFKEASLKKNSLQLIIVGDGPYKDKVRSKIEEYHLDERVTLVGEKSNPYPYMLRCDAIVLTSNYEGFPVTYTEALVLSKKVITTVPVSDGVIDVRNYFEVVPKDVQAISEAMRKVKKKENKYDIDLEQANDYNLTKFKSLIEKK